MLHVALLDHRTCGGEDTMLMLAEGFARRCSEFFYMFLAFRPIIKGRGTDNSSEQQRKRRLNMVVRRFGNLCSVGLVNADLITLCRSTGRDGTHILTEHIRHEGIRDMLSKPVKAILNLIACSCKSSKDLPSVFQLFGCALQLSLIHI